MKKLFGMPGTCSNRLCYKFANILVCGAAFVAGIFTGEHISKSITNYVRRNKAETINQDKKGS